MIVLSPEETYIAEKEYPDYSSKLDGLRGRIVASLPLEARMKILDVATGSANFAIARAVARVLKPRGYFCFTVMPPRRLRHPHRS